MLGHLEFPCDAVFAAPTHFRLSRFTNSGVKSVAVNTRSAFKLAQEIVSAITAETLKLRLDARWQSVFPDIPL